MERPFIQIRSANVPPDALADEASWDSALFLRTLGWSSQTAPLAASCWVFEGQRQRSHSAELVTYQARDISFFDLRPTPGQLCAQASLDPLAVQPGDVVLKRVAPVAAAVVVAGLPRLPVDSNCFVVRGLSEVEAWWFAFCLNFPACADYLLSKSGRGILSRLSLSVLRGWTAPAAPVAFARLAPRLTAVLTKRVFLASQLNALKSEVEKLVAERMAATEYAEVEARFSGASWSFFFPAKVFGTSWLPAHAATEYCAEVLNRDRDWQEIASCLLPEPPSRERWSKIEEPIPVLRLGDIGEVPLVPGSVRADIPAQTNRVFRAPLQPEDVVLSTLGSSPRAALMPSHHKQRIYPADHWERLRFRDHAAAFTLILQTSVVGRQMRSLAVGSVQQFIRPDDIQRLFLPVLPAETLGQWDRAFRALSNSWAQTDADWSAALAEGWQIFRPIAQNHNELRTF